MTFACALPPPRTTHILIRLQTVTAANYVAGSVNDLVADLVNDSVNDMVNDLANGLGNDLVNDLAPRCCGAAARLRLFWFTYEASRPPLLHTEGRLCINGPDERRRNPNAKPPSSSRQPETGTTKKERATENETAAEAPPRKTKLP